MYDVGGEIIMWNFQYLEPVNNISIAIISKLSVTQLVTNIDIAKHRAKSNTSTKILIFDVKTRDKSYFSYDLADSKVLTKKFLNG